MHPPNLWRILLAATIAVPSTGCYSTWDIPAKEVARLDGYRAPTPKVITSQEGEEVRVDQDTELLFHAGLGIPDLQAKLDAIDIHDAPGEWWLSGILHGDGQPFRVDLRKVTQLSAKRFSAGNTTLAVLVPVLVVGLAVGITLGVVVATIPKD